MTEKKYVLKDDLFNEVTVKKLTNAIKVVYPKFNEVGCFNEIILEMPVLELKERVTLIRIKLEKYLPNDYYKSTKILLASLKTLDDYNDFVFASYSEYVEINGCNDEDIDYSLEMLGEYTKYFSSEFSIRKFIINYPQKTYNKMLAWSLSEDVDQRRLASEGLRPKLPWAIKIDFDYINGLEPLNNLFFDSSRYVVRSVANHLNDISKIDPDRVVDILSKWQNSNKQEETEMNYLINHALRTSIKRGHIKSLEFIGFNENPEIKLSNLSLVDDRIKIGESIEFNFNVTGLKSEKLMIDFKIVYPMAKGKTSTKVFKIKRISIEEGETVKIVKRHAFKVMTTKKLYTGNYLLCIQINGKNFGDIPFDLSVENF